MWDSMTAISATGGVNNSVIYLPLSDHFAVQLTYQANYMSRPSGENTSTPKSSGEYTNTPKPSGGRALSSALQITMTMFTLQCLM